MGQQVRKLGVGGSKGRGGGGVTGDLGGRGLGRGLRRGEDRAESGSGSAGREEVGRGQGMNLATD